MGSSWSEKLNVDGGVGSGTLTTQLNLHVSCYEEKEKNSRHGLCCLRLPLHINRNLRGFTHDRIVIPIDGYTIRGLLVSLCSWNVVDTSCIYFEKTENTCIRIGIYNVVKKNIMSTLCSIRRFLNRKTKKFGFRVP